MTQMLGTLGSAIDLLLVVAGFGFIVFFHELGHFLAARWAGIRVLTFALGFGPAACSYRSGLGFRRGSSEPEYESLKRRSPSLAAEVSPTEYRFNWLPFGGYVRMLGQEDLNPDAVSAESDSYQKCKPWKRMVVISAGVICNIILASVLFLVVFMAGLRTEPAMIGAVETGSPAGAAIATNAASLGVAQPGLQPGDTLLEINDTKPSRANGQKPNTFNDLMLETAMTHSGEPVRLVVQREGVAGPLQFEIKPRLGVATGLQELGVGPSYSAAVGLPTEPSRQKEVQQFLKRNGLLGLEAGMTLTQVNGRAAQSADAVVQACRDSGGNAVNLTFAKGAETLSIVMKPRLEMQSALSGAGDAKTSVSHVLGLQPVMTCEDASPAGTPRASDQGLQDGDVFARIGDVEFPSVVEGMRAIRANAGKRIAMSVLRKDAAGRWATVDFKDGISVGRDGRIGFLAGDTSETSALIAAPLGATNTQVVNRANGKLVDFSAPSAGVFTAPGSTIVEVAGTPVKTFDEVRTQLRAATAKAHELKAESATVPIVIQRPLAASSDSERASETLAWTLKKADIDGLHALGWQPAFPLDLVFEPRQITLKGDGPIAAVRMGMSETRRVMLSTYSTFLRLFQGTVKVEHLKGPVGIAHMGTIIADRGFVWLLFFMAMISVNLAVINFMPLPIVDGGQFLFLVFEQVRGKPAPIAFQNVATMAGLLLIGSVFLIVTYHDIRHLFGI